VVKDSGATVD